MSEIPEQENETDQCTIYSFTQDDVDAVNPVNWHETFKDVCPKTIICPIPAEVLKYLKAEGVMMPQDTHTTGQNLGAAASSGGGGGREENDDEGSWASMSSHEEDLPSIPVAFLQDIGREQRRASASQNGNGDHNGDEPILEETWRRPNSSNTSSEDEDDACPLRRKKLEAVEKFHDFDSLIDDNIKQLGGAVMPKLNRKAPKDADWIGFNRSLKCYNAGDIYLLLKTSCIVSQALENPYKGCYAVENAPSGPGAESLGAASASGATDGSTYPFVLVLKEWDDSWGPEMEFRCFISANMLIAICQRDLDTCHSSIIKRKDKLLLNIQNFFIQKVQGLLPIEFYVMDIICHPNGEIYIMDFDVFGTVTDSLLFTYRELGSIYEEMKNDLATTNEPEVPGEWDENKMADYLSGNEEEQTRPMPRSKSPHFRFLTESRNFRGRKKGNHSELTNDVMTYIRESVPKK